MDVWTDRDSCADGGKEQKNECLGTKAEDDGSCEWDWGRKSQRFCCWGGADGPLDGQERKAATFLMQNAEKRPVFRRSSGTPTKYS